MERKDAPTFELTTATLDEILTAARAPAYIDYMSIDLQGAEYEALCGMSLDKWRVGAFTIEHMYEEPKRTLIRALLESHGYLWARGWQVEDWYVDKRFAPRVVGFLNYARMR